MVNRLGAESIMIEQLCTLNKRSTLTMNHFQIRTVKTLAIVICLLLLHQSADAAGWGSLQGRFVLDGSAPEFPPVDASKDAYCVEHQPVNEHVVVGDDGGLANVVLYIRLGRRDKIEPHPDYAAALKEPATLDNKYCAFHPHVTLVRTGQTLVIKNSDQTGHNTNLRLVKNGATNTTIEAGSETQRSLTKAEAIPLPVDCNIHPFMHGYVLVQDHPYMAVSSEDGTFEIENIPAGKYEFQFWHEASGYMKNLKYKGGALNRQGRADLTIVDGQTLDLGEIKVPASSLQ
jgi:plastocyanin